MAWLGFFLFIHENAATSQHFYFSCLAPIYFSYYLLKGDAILLALNPSHGLSKLTLKRNSTASWANAIEALLQEAAFILPQMHFKCKFARNECMNETMNE